MIKLTEGQVTKGEPDGFVRIIDGVDDSLRVGYQRGSSRYGTGATL